MAVRKPGVLYNKRVSRLGNSGDDNDVAHRYIDENNDNFSRYIYQKSQGFESNLGDFDTSFSTAGSIVDRHADAANTGLFGVRLQPTLSVQGQIASAIDHTLPLPTANSIITQTVYFIIPTGVTDKFDFEVAVEGWTGSLVRLSSIRYVKDSAFPPDRFQYWNSSAAWQTVTGSAGTLAVDTVHKLVTKIDWLTGEYVEMSINSTVIDMSGIAFDDAASALAPFFQVAYLVHNLSTTPIEVYFDDSFIQIDRSRA